MPTRPRSILLWWLCFFPVRKLDGNCWEHRLSNNIGVVNHAGIEPSHLTTLRLRLGMASFWRFLGWLRVPLSLEAPVSIRCGPRVFGLYSLPGAEGEAAGLFAGLSCAQSAIQRVP
jgi:hypothetical protein